MALPLYAPSISMASRPSTEPTLPAHNLPVLYAYTCTRARLCYACTPHTTPHLLLLPAFGRGGLYADRLDESEKKPLLDALGRNSSLTYLSLAQTGLDWDGPSASGAALLETMNRSRAALSSLKKFVISDVSGFEMPIAALRSPSDALGALRHHAFFAPAGPWRKEILFMGDLMRKTGAAVDSHLQDMAGDSAVRLLEVCARGKLRREGWQTQLTALMAEGNLRRGALLNLVSAETLRSIHFEVPELLAVSFTLQSLRLGGFTAAEVRAAGLRAAELGQAGYTPAELRVGGYMARELKQSGFGLLEMREGGYLAQALKEIGYSAKDLAGAGWTPSELREGTFSAKELKALGYGASPLRVAGFVVKELQQAGFSLADLKAGTYTPTELRGEGGYGCSEMRRVGFDAAALRAAGYSGSEMVRHALAAYPCYVLLLGITRSGRFQTVHFQLWHTS